MSSKNLPPGPLLPGGGEWWRKLTDYDNN